MRLRVAKPAPGTGGAVRETARWLGLDHTVILYQVRKGAIALLPDGRVDWVSAWEWAKNYEPHKDNQGRRPRLRRADAVLAAPRAAAPVTAPSHTNGHPAPNGHATGAPRPGFTLADHPSPSAVPARSLAAPSAPAAPSAGPGQALPDARRWIEEYKAAKARASADGELREQTEGSYDWVFDQFLARFKALPMTRKEVLDYIHGLRDRTHGGPLSPGSKWLVHRVLTALYHWLKREYGYEVPDLTKPGLPAKKREHAVPIWPRETRLVLKQAQNSTERLIITLLAQTALRIGELCTIRPETLHRGWVEVWGKPTRANPTGWRQVPIPDEAYRLLTSHLQLYKRLQWIDGNMMPKPLAGPLQPAVKGRAINLEETAHRPGQGPETYLVRPASGAVQKVQDWLRRRMKNAGVYEPGKGAHSFRRAYQSEFVANGGDGLLMRRIMGHFNAQNMDDLYTHIPIERLVEHANRHCPRAFLREEAAQAEMALEAQPLPDQGDEDDDD